MDNIPHILCNLYVNFLSDVSEVGWMNGGNIYRYSLMVY